MRTLAIVLTATLLTGCAMTPGGGTTGYQAELDALEASCDARNGILQPTGRSGSARPQEDYVCRITGGPSERLQRPGG